MGTLQVRGWRIPRRYREGVRDARRRARARVRGLAALSLFVDTSALYALFDADDSNHQAASAFFEELPQRDPLTHNYVVLETTALVARRLGGRAVRALHQKALPPLQMVWIDQPLHDAAVAGMLAAPRSPVSLVDRASFEVMRSLGVQEAFAFDRDFAAAGFDVVP
jgi:predicted nucleic acid-binding protein